MRQEATPVHSLSVTTFLLSVFNVRVLRYTSVAPSPPNSANVLVVSALYLWGRMQVTVYEKHCIVNVFVQLCMSSISLIFFGTHLCSTRQAKAVRF